MTADMREWRASPAGRDLLGPCHLLAIQPDGVPTPIGTVDSPRLAHQIATEHNIIVRLRQDLGVSA